MKILIAEDDSVTRRLLAGWIGKWGIGVESVGDGPMALDRITHSKESMLCLLDWILPGMDGIDLLKEIRHPGIIPYIYVILLTCKNRTGDLVRGINAGADDFISKPFHWGELKARIRAGMRILELQERLNRNIQCLQEALTREKRLQGLIPICSYCKKIRDDRNYWHQLEVYFTEHSSAEFTHSVCPACAERLVQSYSAASRTTCSDA